MTLAEGMEGDEEEEEEEEEEGEEEEERDLKRSGGGMSLGMKEENRELDIRGFKVTYCRREIERGETENRGSCERNWKTKKFFCWGEDHKVRNEFVTFLSPSPKMHFKLHR